MHGTTKMATVHLDLEVEVEGASEEAPINLVTP